MSNATRDYNCYSRGSVFLDQLNVSFTKGNLKEENHYYPHGLPITTLSSQAEGLQEQRRKYQSNEYIKDLDLNWMDFQARQYDPQTGRFLGVDPLADKEEQDYRSPYAAMGTDPVSMVDPNGLENTVYIVNLPNSGLNSKQLNTIIGALNAWMKSADLNITFTLFEPIMGVEFDRGDLSESDAVVVLGEKNEVSKYIQNDLGLPTFRDGNEWGEYDNPGVTMLNVSAVSTNGSEGFGEYFNVDFMTAITFVIQHEIGHYAKDRFNMFTTPSPHQGELAEGVALQYNGNTIRDKLMGAGVRNDSKGKLIPDDRFKSLKDLQKKEYNAEYIKSLRKVFNSNYSKDNRLKRHFHPNQSDWFYRSF